MSGVEEAVPVRTSRNRNPLKWRRVRHVASERTGYIEGERLHDGVSHPYFHVVWDDAEVQYGGWRRSEKVSPAELTILDPPPIEAAVRVRKVLFRGHKEQVAERWAALGVAPDGVERYIEFDPQPMAYRRWRIVSIGPALDAEIIAATPDQHKTAEYLRKLAKDNGAYEEPDGYGY